MASSSDSQTRALVKTSTALTADTTSFQTGGCAVTTARSLNPKFFIARAAAPMLFGSRGRTNTILRFDRLIWSVFYYLGKKTRQKNVRQKNKKGLWGSYFSVLHFSVWSSSLVTQMLISSPAKQGLKYDLFRWPG